MTIMFQKYPISDNMALIGEEARMLFLPLF